MISELRAFATDKAIVDWLQLRELFGTTNFTCKQVQDAWTVSQPAACRRLQTLQQLQLISCLQSNPCVYTVEGVN